MYISPVAGDVLYVLWSSINYSSESFRRSFRGKTIKLDLPDPGSKSEKYNTLRNTRKTLLATVYTSVLSKHVMNNLKIARNYLPSVHYIHPKFHELRCTNG